MDALKFTETKLLWSISTASSAECLFGHQYAVEMLLPAGQRSTAWVKRLPDVVAALNNEVTRLTGKKLCCDQRESCFSKTFHFLLKVCLCGRKKSTRLKGW